MADAERDALIMRAYEVYTATVKATSPPFLATLESVRKGVKTYTFKHRIKGSAAIESKVRRKRELGTTELIELEKTVEADRDARWDDSNKQARDNATYSPDNVTDVLGCRYVTLYQSEIPLIVEELLKVIGRYNLDDANEPIIANEFVIYTNRPAKDPLSITNDTLRIVERSPLFKEVPSSIRQPESRKSAYSSVHFVFSHDVDIEHAGRKDPTREQCFFEVQIRDIFEEGWGEVQHDLLYSEKDKLGDETNPMGTDHVQWSLHLNALKTFVDGCSQHASIIKANLDGIRATRSPLTANQSVSERKADLANIIQVLHRVQASKAIETLVSQGYTLLMSGADLAAQSDAADLKDAFSRLLDAARHLDEALASLNSRQRRAVERHSGNLTVGYFLEMERAAARTTAAALPDAKDRAVSLKVEAEAIYETVIKSFPDDPTVHMRLGKIIEQRATTLADFKRSQSLFERTIDLVNDDPTTGSDHWVAISCRLDVGFSLWKQIVFLDQQLTADQRCDMYAEAAVETAKALEIWQLQSPTRSELNKVVGHKAASNVIFYLAAIHENGRALSTQQIEQLGAMITHVENFGVEPYADWYKTRDNLLHGYSALNQPDQVKVLAHENFNELRARAEDSAGRPLDIAEIRNHLSNSPLKCFETALRALGEGKVR